MFDTLNKYLHDKLNGESCNYYLICNKEEYCNNIGNCDVSDDYLLNNFVFNLVINTMISIMISEEKIFLHDKLNKYINGYNDDILIIHLLTHSSGINNNFKPGDNVIIDNINGIILKDIIEKLYKADINFVAHKYIFSKLDMNDTTILDNDIKTKINDLIKFTKFIMNNGYYNGKYILDVKYIDIWFRPLFIGDNNIRTTIGWVSAKSDYACKDLDCSINAIIYNHSNYILIDRENDLAIIMLFNKKQDDKTKCDINKYIYKLLKEYNKIY